MKTYKHSKKALKKIKEEMKHSLYHVNKFSNGKPDIFPHLEEFKYQFITMLSIGKISEKFDTLDLILFPNLTKLYIQSKCDDIINIPSTLKVLICSGCGLKHLDNLNEGLEELRCEFNNLKRLDNLPSTLRLLVCSSNRLKTLSKLPENLDTLICHNNVLTNLINLNLRMKKFYCIQHKRINHIAHGIKEEIVSEYYKYEI